MAVNDDISDEELMARLQAGRAEAFDALVLRHTSKFYGLAWKTCPDKHEAEDIVQEAFMKLWQNPKSFDPAKGAKFTTWFYRVVLNLALDRAKKKRPVTGEEVIMQMADYDLLPPEALEERQRQMLLETAIQELPERQRTAINLCYTEGLSNKDAADVMDIGLKALESLLMRAKAGIKDMMTRQGLMEDAA